MENVEGISKRIAERRVAVGLTQAKLADILNTSMTMVSRWEKGKFRPSVKYIRKLAEALQTTTSYLYGETDDPDAVEVTKKTTWTVGGNETKGTERVVDYSLKMGSWGVEATRTIGEGGEIRINATRGAELRIKALMEAVWERIGGGTVRLVGDSAAMDGDKAELYLKIDRLEEAQFNRFFDEVMRLISKITEENSQSGRK